MNKKLLLLTVLLSTNGGVMTRAAMMESITNALQKYCVPKPNSYICEACKAGTYSDGEKCETCPAGTFMNNTGASACSKCPDYCCSNPGSTGCGEVRA